MIDIEAIESMAFGETEQKMGRLLALAAYAKKLNACNTTTAVYELLKQGFCCINRPNIKDVAWAVNIRLSELSRKEGEHHEHMRYALPR
jgi:hypothetical protein